MKKFDFSKRVDPPGWNNPQHFCLKIIYYNRVWHKCSPYFTHLKIYFWLIYIRVSRSVGRWRIGKKHDCYFTSFKFNILHDWQRHGWLNTPLIASTNIILHMIKSLLTNNNFGPSAMCALCVTNCNGQLTLLRLFLSVSLLLSPVFTFLPEGLFLGFWIFACKHILTQKYEKMQNNLGSTNKLCKHIGRFKKEFGSKNLGVQKIWVQQFSKLMGKYVVG